MSGSTKDCRHMSENKSRRGDMRKIRSRSEWKRKKELKKWKLGELGKPLLLVEAFERPTVISSSAGIIRDFQQRLLQKQKRVLRRRVTVLDKSFRHKLVIARVDDQKVLAQIVLKVRAQSHFEGQIGSGNVTRSFFEQAS